MKDRNRLLLCLKLGGLAMGRSEIGGVPKVRQ